jgi:hypothetical protein
LRDFDFRAGRQEAIRVMSGYGMAASKRIRGRLARKMFPDILKGRPGTCVAKASVALSGPVSRTLRISRVSAPRAASVVAKAVAKLLRFTIAP